MIKPLIKISNKLDQLGHYDLANQLDRIIRYAVEPYDIPGESRPLGGPHLPDDLPNGPPPGGVERRPSAVENMSDAAGRLYEPVHIIYLASQSSEVDEADREELSQMANNLYSLFERLGQIRDKYRK